MTRPLRLLHLEDNAGDATYIKLTLLEHGVDCEVECVETRAAFVAALEASAYDLILADYHVPGFTGLEALAIALQRYPLTPFIFVTEVMGEDVAVEALQRGATDYVRKQHLTRLVPAVRRALREAEERQRRQAAETALQLSETRFRAMFEQFPLSVQILSPDGTTLQVNRAWETMWNIKFADIAGYNMLQDQQLVAKGVMPYIEGAFAGTPADIPAILYEPRDTIDVPGARARWVRAFVCPVKDPAGEVREIALVHEDITAQKEIEDALRESETKLRTLAESDLIGIQFADIDGGISYANDVFLRMVGYTRADVDAGNVRWIDLTPPEYLPLDQAGIREARQRGSCTPYEKEYARRDGSRVPVLVGYVLLGPERRDWVAFIMDLTETKRTERALREQTETLETINRVGQTVAAELDLHRLVQTVTDAATELSGAEFGAFFYNLINEQGESYTLYTISGVPAESFSSFPMPRNTEVFGPTFRGEGSVRLDDVTRDPRYGLNAPYNGMPSGHLPVRSYLAVSVVSRSGEVLGGLFFGHSRTGVFTERAQHVVEGLAGQAAIAMDNARLFEAVRREQAQAQANEQYYRFLAESIPQIVWTAPPSGVTDFYNQRWYEYTGLTPEQAFAVAGTMPWHPDDVPQGLAAWRGAVPTGESYQVESRLRRADGVYRWHLVRAEPLRDEQGAVVKWFGTCTDIDDQKRASERLSFLARASGLLASSLDYKTTLESVAQLAVSHLADWCTVDMVENGVIQRLAVAHRDPAKVAWARELEQRYPPDPKAVHGPPNVLRTGQPEMLSDIPQQLLEQGARDAAHLEIIRSVGFKSYMCVPIIARGHALGAITFVSTFSNRSYQAEDLVLAEELGRAAARAVDNALLYSEAQQARDLAEEASRAKDEFLATLSHELRTPLNAMLGWVSLLRGGRLDAATTEQALETIERNTRMQTQLIEDILDVSRIITGKLNLDTAPVALDRVIEAALDTVRPAAAAKGVGLTAQLDAAAGPVAGDATRLQQVVWNLVSNAVKFTPRGGRIDVSLRPVDSHIEIRVQDTGAGIAPAFLPHVFDRFRQADSSSTRHHGGLGLGLAIVKHLVELHGGQVSVDSPGLDGGASFTVALPRLAVRPSLLTDFPDTALQSPEAASGTGGDRLPSLAGVHVLVLDDEADARRLVATVLEQCAARVTNAANVVEALAALRAGHPDIVISDIGMPGEDGYAFIARVRQLPAADGGQTPAIALTAYARTEDRMRAEAAGYQLHVAKPVDPEELVVAVCGVLGRVGQAA